MIASLINFYLSSVLQPIMPISKEPEAVTIEEFAFSGILAENTAIPIKRSEFISPIIESRSVIAIDKQTGATLYEKSSHEKRQIASITKLMTAAIILEENEMDSIVTVTKLADGEEGSTMFLHQGEQMTIENLMYGLMINSANDSAITLAEFNAGSVDKFVEKMNKKAELLGLLDTHFQNPVGLDNKYNYSSAYDIAKLARHVYQYDFIKKAATTKEMEVKSVDGKYIHPLKSTNELLDSYLKIKGLKTGKTDKAGLCLVTIAENDNSNEIVTVLLGSPARFQESKILIDWVFRAYIW